MVVGEQGEYHGDMMKKRSSLGIRHVQVMLLFQALVLVYAMRVNMSIAIVAMTDRDNDDSFDWSIQTQSVILSSFFWGYVVLQIAGAELAARFGGKLLIIPAVAINSVVLLLLPIGAYYGGWELVCACRVVQGLAQGVIYPTIHNLVGKWIPLEEKGSLITIIYSGSQLGTALQLIASGFIADAWGWQAIFYVNGVLGVVWTILYVFFGADSPETSKLINPEERLYIQTSLGQVGVQKRLVTPWRKIWTSLAFISVIVAHCGHLWGFWTLMTEMPSYMKQVLDVDIKSNGVLTSLPYIGMYLVSFVFGFLSDHVLKKKWLSVTALRKVSNTIGECGPALALIVLSYAPAGNVAAAVVLLIIVVSLNAGHFTGFLLVHIDMAPNFAGSMMGISNTFASIASLVAPLAAGAILKDETDPSEWRKIFYLASAVYIASNTFFIIFSTSERQQWNDVSEDTGSSPDKESQKNVSDVDLKLG